MCGSDSTALGNQPPPHRLQPKLAHAVARDDCRHPTGQRNHGEAARGDPIADGEDDLAHRLSLELAAQSCKDRTGRRRWGVGVS